MDKMKSWDELKTIRENALDLTKMRTADDNKIVIRVGLATCGIAAGARETINTLQTEIQNNNLENIVVIGTGCLGYCYLEPMVEVHEPNKPVIRYGNVDEKLAKKIITSHIIAGELIDEKIVSKEVDRP